MSEISIAQADLPRERLTFDGLFTRLGLLFGIVMPVLAAFIYPTYAHVMASPQVEWTRLVELPFVVCEIGVIYAAWRGGMQSGDYWRALPRDARFALVLMLVGLTVSSVFVSKEPTRSVLISMITIVHLQFFATIHFFAVRKGLADLRAFMPLLGAGMVVLALLTAWKFSFPPPAAQVPGGKIEWGNALPGFISVRHFGSWTGAITAGFLVALLYSAPDRTERWSRLWYTLGICLSAWSGTRAVFAALVGVGLIFGITLRQLPDRRALAQVAGLTAVGMLIAYCLPVPSQEFWLFDSDDLQNADNLSGGRLVLWQATFFKWLQAPMFGWGSGSTFWEVYVGWAHTQPHNVILQCLISWGIVGAAGALWLLGRAIAAVHRQGAADVALRPLMGMTYALLLMSLEEGMLHYPRFIMIIAMGLAVVLARKQLPAS
jgi:exopolysaccharide production protein ExoQ